MIFIYTNLRPCVLTRVWLWTTDRNLPLRAVWIDTSLQASAASAAQPTSTEGGPLCA